jgi:hypothetical protein
VTEEDSTLDEAMDGSKEAAGGSGAPVTGCGPPASSIDPTTRSSPAARAYRSSAALAMTDAAFVEARHGSEPSKRRPRGRRMSSREHYA